MPTLASKNPKRRLMRVVRANMEDRREQVGRLYCEGVTQTQIAKQLGVTQPTVSSDLETCFSEWKAKYARSYDDKVRDELAKIDALERQAQSAFARSQRPKVDDEGNEVEQQGNPAWLDKIGWCIETRLKLLGKLDERSVNVNQTVMSWETLFASKADPALAEKRAPVIAAVDDPIERDLKQLETQAGIER